MNFLGFMARSNNGRKSYRTRLGKEAEKEKVRLEKYEGQTKRDAQSYGEGE